jgi:hypothetical protein
VPYTTRLISPQSEVSDQGSCWEMNRLIVDKTPH